MKHTRIILFSIMTVHLVVMVCLYIPALQNSFPWCHYFNDDLGCFVVRPIYSLILAWIISMILFYYGLKTLGKNSPVKGKYYKSISLFIAGIYFFYLSGQTVVLNMGHYKMDVYFSVFELRSTDLTLGCFSENVNYQLTNGVFYSRITTNCDSVSFTVLDGIGPFFSLRDR